MDETDAPRGLSEMLELKEIYQHKYTEFNLIGKRFKTQLLLIHSGVPRTSESNDLSSHADK